MLPCRKNRERLKLPVLAEYKGIIHDHVGSDDLSKVSFTVVHNDTHGLAAGNNVTVGDDYSIVIQNNAASASSIGIFDNNDLVFYSCDDVR
jgi:hypothetical protein